jgi:hypothetical protein
VWGGAGAGVNRTPEAANSGKDGDSDGTGTRLTALRRWRRVRRAAGNDGLTYVSDKKTLRWTPLRLVPARALVHDVVRDSFRAARG